MIYVLNIHILHVKIDNVAFHKYYFKHRHLENGQFAYECLKFS